MSNMQTKPMTLSTSQAHDLRRTFESAIAQVRRSDEPLSASKKPIFVRKATVPLRSDDMEKRALTDAARALAQLWNISPTLVR
jgi:hypothetical protein